MLPSWKWQMWEPSFSMADGCIRVWLEMDDSYYYQMLSDLVGENIHNEYQLLHILKEMAKMKKEYVRVLHAIEAVRLSQTA